MGRIVIEAIDPELPFSSLFIREKDNEELLN